MPDTSWRSRIVAHADVDPRSITPHPQNFRTHPQHQADATEGNIQDLGWIRSVIVNKRSGRCLDGHLRIELALKRGEPTIPVEYVDLSDHEEAQALATIDPLAALAETNRDALKAVLDSVATSNEAVVKMLEDLAVQNHIIPADIVEGAGGDEFDTTAQEGGPTRCKTGDLWIIGGVHRLLCGDSTKAEDVKRLMGAPKINLCFTSPPYAEQREYDNTSGFKPIPPNEYVEWWENVQSNIKAHFAADGSFFVNIKPSADGLDTQLYVFDLVCAMVRRWNWHFATEFCWERSGVPKGVTQRFKNQFEPVYQFVLARWKMRPESVMHESDAVPIPIGKGAGNTGWGNERQGKGGGAVLENRAAPGKAYPGNRLPTFGSAEVLGHTAAFPVGLPSFFVKAYTDEGDVVFDPFGGQGTTLIAAHRHKRIGYTIELSPKYCDVILRRCEAEGLSVVLD